MTTHPKRLCVHRADESSPSCASNGPGKYQLVRNKPRRAGVRWDVHHGEPFVRPPPECVFDYLRRRCQTAGKKGEAGALKLAKAVQHLLAGESKFNKITIDYLQPCVWIPGAEATPI